MKKIKLPGGVWEYDPDNMLGPKGGFGAVYLGKNIESEEQVAVKILNIDASDAGHRELDIAEDLLGNDFKNVMQILDAGQDAESERYCIIMPKAEKSLQQEIDEKGSINEDESIKIIISILKGLQEVSHIVHRDLKPGNILFHAGEWKVADFGIARFIEKSTSLGTLKNSLTPGYAAPEQWRSERATNETDIYALGCIIYSLVTGTPPFLGPEFEDFSEQHLQERPKPLECINPQLGSLSSMMLRKTSSSRPSANRVINILSSIYNNDSPEGKMGNLAKAAAKVEEAEALLETEKIKERMRREERENSMKGGNEILENVISSLVDEIKVIAPNVRIGKHKPDFLVDINLGTAILQIIKFDSGRLIEESEFSNSGWDVITGIIITIKQQTHPRYEWGANGWYANIKDGSGFRWFEVGYRKNAFVSSRPVFQPYAVFDTNSADLAVSSIMDVTATAYTPKIFDDENIPDFIARWSDLLAKASQGQLVHPNSMPLQW